MSTKARKAQHKRDVKASVQNVHAMIGGYDEQRTQDIKQERIGRSWQEELIHLKKQAGAAREKKNAIYYAQAHPNKADAQAVAARALQAIEEAEKALQDFEESRALELGVVGYTNRLGPRDRAASPLRSRGNL